MAENEEFKYGVKKEIIQKKIDDYLKILEREFSDGQNPIVVATRLENELEAIIKEEEAAASDPEMQHLLEDIRSRKAQKQEELRQLYENEKDYIRAKDVIEELQKLLADSKEEYSFVEIEQIESRLDLYRGILKTLDSEGMQKRKENLQRELEQARDELKELQAKAAEAERTSSTEDAFAGLPDKYREQAIEDLKNKIANRKAMIVARGSQLHPNRYEELRQWEEELELLTNPEKRKRATEQDKKKMDELEQTISDKEEELAEVEKSIGDLESRGQADINLQRRYLEANEQELEELSRARELFKINEKGEFEIKYPPITPEIDEEAIKSEYEARRRDMLDKFYGNRKKGREYREKLYTLEDHFVDKEFEFIDENGQRQKGEYTTIEPYEGMEEDLAFLQLEEIVERLERTTKWLAGDKSVYAGTDDPEQAFKEDDEYIVTDNHAYNKILATSKHLMTLGKYGEKVPYSQMQQGQVGRNILRAIGNAAKFLRNHITAPINAFVGSKIVAPIHDKITGAKDGKTAGVYSNKLTHRYVARRDYYQSQGQGYFRSRFNSIFNAKEANSAILSAGAYDIKQSIIKKYTDIAQREAVRKQTEFMSKSIDEQIEMIQRDMENANPENRQRLEQTLKDLQKARLQVEKDRAANEQSKISQTVQTDAIGFDQHYVANKENVTRTITGVKMLTRFGIRKFVGPRIKDWIQKHTSKSEIVDQPTDLRVPNKKPNKSEIIGEQTPTTPEGTTPGVTTPDVVTPGTIDASEISTGNISMKDLMSSNAGKQIEGYYSVYGGEARPAMYSLTGNEKVTAIFKSVGNGGTGLSDVAGLKAPVLVDGTFASNLLDANGVLNQNVSLETIMNALGDVDTETLSGLYVSVGDRYWVKLSDLCQGLNLKENAINAVTATGTATEQIIEATKKIVSESAASTVGKTVSTVTDGVDAAAKTAETVTRVVENETVNTILDVSGIAHNVVDGGLTVEDIYENIRRTGTDATQTKKAPRQYEGEEKFTGSKKEDYEAIDAAEKKKRDESSRRTREDNDGDER